ncbi:hypothetical protein AB1Y20_018564 [Prymnesium parvum]|uniref:Uncharacterized protein n=1 Tax=Prymnesium parvum TaxID=97485 RepID=A0AB34JS74_PRYPA
MGKERVGSAAMDDAMLVAGARSATLLCWLPAALSIAAVNEKVEFEIASRWQHALGSRDAICSAACGQSLQITTASPPPAAAAASATTHRTNHSCGAHQKVYLSSHSSETHPPPACSASPLASPPLVCATRRWSTASGERLVRPSPPLRSRRRSASSAARSAGSGVKSSRSRGVCAAQTDVWNWNQPHKS